MLEFLVFTVFVWQFQWCIESRVLSSLIPFVIANGPHNSFWKANLTPLPFKNKNKNKK